ncbi:sensor histidine kinase [Alistipes muris]|uniref:sensor histidine kinase n=1 Tax=Alistipes TaxID=239759 RepID=UPI00203AD3EA|nr:histidine kinase [Alistipes muris]MCX4282492.1 histidine kinase [Alistipes sp.]
MKRPSITIPAVIHLFAAAHVAVAVLSRIFNYVDDVPLTVLTLSMILIVSVRRGLRVELVATLALICIFVAYLFGIYGARFFEQLLGCGIAAPAITTAIVTELIGWLTYAFARSRNPQTSRRMQWSPSTRQIVVSVAAILLFRIFYTSLFSSPYFEQQGIYPEFYRLLGNTLALMTMFCGNIIFVNQRARLFRRRGLRLAASALFTLGFVLLLTAAVYFGLPQGNGAALSARHFFRLYTVVLLVDIVVYAMLQLAVYVIESHRELRSERGKKHRALFHYDRLKQQINPHFLFNSLNILDYLVQEHETERASAFIRKLAATYRYMLKKADEQLVPLEEELEFARQYIDLLQERFTKGFEVEVDIPRPLLRRYVVPCCLQLLIENAIKHNVVSPEQPLHVRIAAAGDRLTVSNNLQLRMNAPASTGVGLRNIRQQYLDTAGAPILVERTDTEFRVQLPLL